MNNIQNKPNLSFGNRSMVKNLRPELAKAREAYVNSHKYSNFVKKDVDKRIRRFEAITFQDVQAINDANSGKTSALKKLLKEARQSDVSKTSIKIFENMFKFTIEKVEDTLKFANEIGKIK